MALVCDTGPLLAALDAADPDHERCARLLTDATEDLIVPTLVLAELDYWCSRRLGSSAWLVFLEDALAGVYRVESPTGADLARCRDLQDRYADLSLGVVDASIVALVGAPGRNEGGDARPTPLPSRATGPCRGARAPALTALAPDGLTRTAPTRRAVTARSGSPRGSSMAGSGLVATTGAAGGAIGSTTQTVGRQVGARRGGGPASAEPASRCASSRRSELGQAVRAVVAVGEDGGQADGADAARRPAPRRGARSGRSR